MSKSEVTPTQRMLNIWAITLIIWSFYRATFKSELPMWFDEFVAKPFVFLTPAYFYIRQTEKKPFWEGVGFTRKNISKTILFGAIFGLLFLLIAALSRYLRGIPFVPLEISISSIMWVAATCMAALLEQTLSTGFVFKRLAEEKGAIARPLIISSVLFFFLHVPVLFGADKISGTTLIQMMILNTLLSLTTSTLFLIRKNTVAPFIVHALYLLSLPLLGVI